MESTVATSPVFRVDKSKTESAFKLIITEILTSKRIEPSIVLELNKIIATGLIKGMQAIDTSDKKNVVALEQLVDDLWVKFERELNMKLLKYRKNFEK